MRAQVCAPKYARPEKKKSNDEPNLAEASQDFVHAYDKLKEAAR
jgi:hypothetical protein